MERVRDWIERQFDVTSVAVSCTCECVSVKVSRHTFMAGTSCAFCDDDNDDGNNNNNNGNAIDSSSRSPGE
jgi:hypothetical protein